MAKTGVPKVDTGAEGEWTAGGGGVRANRVEIAGAVTSVEEHPGTTILDRETKSVKFHSHRVFTTERLNGNKIFNQVRRNKNIMERERSGSGRKRDRTSVSNGKSMTVANDDARGSGSGCRK
jgi:hypothetical protein